MIYHTNTPFSGILIALISLLTFLTIPPACIFHARPGVARMHPRMTVVNTLKKKKTHLISRSTPGALCATIMFTLCSASSEATANTALPASVHVGVRVKMWPSERKA